MGHLDGSGGGHQYLLWDPQPYLVDRGALPVLLLVLLGLGFYLDLWGAIGADFSPGPSMGVLGLDCQRYVVEAS